jgi:hypothetical protein
MLDDDRVECQVCRISLDKKTHFMNHAHKIHGTVSPVKKKKKKERQNGA